MRATLDRQRESPPSALKAKGSEVGFFERDLEPAPEALQGIVREKQIIAFAGYFGIGKSPALEDLTVCAIRGIPWCGRTLIQRPVITFDFESASPKYRCDINAIARRLGVDPPIVSAELDIYLATADPATEPATRKLLAAVADEPETRIELIEEALSRKPNALVIIDPVDLMFPGVDKMKSQQVVGLYMNLRRVMSKYPRSLFWLTFNLRKPHREARTPSLLGDPRGWLHEVAGSGDIVNRCDVRLGIDLFQDEIRVVNGIRRGEEMNPLLIQPAGDPDQLSGFEVCHPSQINLRAAFTPRQLEYWKSLPEEFRFEEIAGKSVPRSSLSRLIGRAESIGLLHEMNGSFQKLVRGSSGDGGT